MVKKPPAMWETWVQFDPWVGKIPWSREQLFTSVFLPREFHGQRSLANYSPECHKESDMVDCTHTHTCKSRVLTHAEMHG